MFHEPIVSKGVGGLVLVRDIDFASVSEESLLPFHGRCHIAYVPSAGVVLGLSKLARLTKLCAKRVQTQERLSEYILQTLSTELRPEGAAVILGAKHLTYSGSQPTQQTTVAVSGTFAVSNSHLLSEALAMLDMDLEEQEVQVLSPSKQFSCNETLRLQQLLAAYGYCSGFSPLSASHPAEADSPMAPVTPDASEDDADSYEQLSCSDQDTDSMELAVQVLLYESGIDSASLGLQSSIRRYVMSLLASTSGYHQELPSKLAPTVNTFLNQDHQRALAHAATGGVVCGCNGAAAPYGLLWHEHHLPFTSQCEHHMLPFYGTLHIAYAAPAGCAATLSPLSECELEQLVSTFTQRLQVQERITQQVADAVARYTGAAGVMVVAKAAHMCMVARGVENHAGTTLTRAASGLFADQPELRTRFLRAVNRCSRNGEDACS